LTQIASIFGQKLPLSSVFEAPTIEKLARLLEQQAPVRTSKRRSSLVKIQDSLSRRPPFFCVPGNLGNVFVDFEYLYRHLGQDQPFYGFQDGLGNPSKIETLAARYVEDIRRIQPDGPYFLGGICFGGPVVFEMAQQLVQQGQRVPFLALIEPATLPLPGANSYTDLFNDIWKRFTRPRAATKKTIKMNSMELITFLRLRVKLIANIWSLKQYAPRPYLDRFHLFLTKESLAKDSFLCWREFAVRGAEVQEIPGTHRSITGDSVRIEEQQMRVLGEKIKAGIDNVLME
jgi:thioesterase domain-containing protein